ncbi:MAG: hypothetical protein IT223_04435, partial [Crocinitomicaceae bacterium]|nr:hypothetical protein [Crocinitomicaceae bacterium]
YEEAMGKYEGALKIFPKDTPAKKKYDEAKSARDAELASKQKNAAYDKLMADGENNIKSKKWDDAKKNFQEASKLKPEEVTPKEKLYEIDQLIKAEKVRAQYDQVIADADAKFGNKDYAVCIDRYKEASKLLPNESYPKDQIAKAQSIMDMMMADEAKRKQIEQDYKNQVTLGDRNFKDKNYENALTNYREASRIKPDENYPDQKIKEIEKLISDLKAKKDQETSIANAEEERKRIEKEYNEHILAADKFYKDSKQKDTEMLESAKAEYGAALALKSNEKYPKAQVTSIESLLASLNNKKNNDLEAEAKRLEQERAKQADEMRRQKEEQEKLAEQQRQKRIEEEETRRKEREAALAAAKEKDESRRKFLTIDRSKEDEVDAYYREAREIEEAAKTQGMKERKESYESYTLQRDADAGIARKEKLDYLNGQKEGLIQMDKNGDTLIDKSTEKLEEKKKQDTKNTSGYNEKAGNRQKQSIEKADEKKEAQQGLTDLDRNRIKLIGKEKQMQEGYAEKQKTMESRGDAVRATNIAEVKSDLERQQEMAFDGEKVRQENIQEANYKKEAALNYNKDSQSAANVRLNTAEETYTRKKNEADEYGKGKETLVSDNILHVNKKKQDNEMSMIEKDIESSEKRYNTRQELMEKNSGREKKDDEYKQMPGTENLPEGVSETSYEYGKNKKIIERTVKRGNKIDTYKKVVSKSGIYYFKNNKSITDQMWIQETLQSRE